MGAGAASGTSARLFSAAGQQHVNAQPRRMGAQEEMERPRLDCHCSITPLTFYSIQGLENPSPSSHPDRWNGWDFPAGKRITLSPELQQKSQSRFSLDPFVSHTCPSTNHWGPGTDHPMGQTKSHAQLEI